MSSINWNFPHNTSSLKYIPPLFQNYSLTPMNPATITPNVLLWQLKLLLRRLSKEPVRPSLLSIYERETVSGTPLLKHSQPTLID